MITREGNQRLMQRREAGQMVKICLAGPNSAVWTLFLSAAFFNGEGAGKQSVAWHLQAWATGTARLHEPDRGMGFCWILWDGGESGASKKARVGF